MVQVNTNIKDIPGYEGIYAATMDGRIWSYPREWKSNKGNRNHSGLYLKPWRRVRYWVVELSKNGEKQTLPIHRLVALSFIPNPSGKPFINHLNGDRDDNSVGNLEWCTHAENIQHAYDIGLITPRSGENHKMAKLNWPQVREIRYKRKSGKLLRELAKEYNCDQSTISMIALNKIWDADEERDEREERLKGELGELTSED